MYMGFDDTDSVNGMCTTYLATEFIRHFDDLDLLGHPRLVRLNPNVPWKTRGNAAICLRFGQGQGKSIKIGEIGGKNVHCYMKGTRSTPTEEYFERAFKLVEKNARFEDPKTNPGLAISLAKPQAALYWRAVREVVSLHRHIDDADMDYGHGWKNSRGLIGAVSAMAWHPHDRTYELIAYREQKKWGKPREVDAASVIKMDRKFTGTFNNYDYELKHVAFAPASPCPILFGIRGSASGYLPAAMKAVKSEKIDRWIIYETNQGTDDHIIKASISSLRPYTSVRVRGKVAEFPRMIPGGHLVFSITNGRKNVDCTIYEPAKSFRMVGEKLQPGDLVTVMGAVREEPVTINVEKLHVEQLARVREKVANPMCKKCRKRMKSYGTGQGYRCARCGAKAGPEKAEFSTVKRGIKSGWYEPPVGSRRHLSKPLKRK